MLDAIPGALAAAGDPEPAFGDPAFGDSSPSLAPSLDPFLFEPPTPARRSTFLVPTAQQGRAIDLATRWYRLARNGGLVPRHFYLAGYAGTGKSTIIPLLVEALGARHVLYASFTGKAASIMRRKGCADATTIHKLIYLPVEGGDGLTFELNEESDLARADLLVLDECSMVNGKLAEDLLSFKVPILVLGDPGQLRPIEGEGYFTSRAPDALLTEIHRQAAENPIIAASMAVREDPWCDLRRFADGERLAVLGRRLRLSDLEGADQILVGKHVTRKTINNALRKALGHTEPLPFKRGAKLVCTRNHRDSGLLNGITLTLADDLVLPGTEERRMSAEVMDEDAARHSIVLYTGEFLATAGLLGPDDIAADAPFVKDNDLVRADWGYALTVHKAQGSQWDRVCVADDGFGRLADERARWLYTCLTRASESILIGLGR